MFLSTALSYFNYNGFFHTFALKTFALKISHTFALKITPSWIVISDVDFDLLKKWHSIWKVKLCAWLMILDDCFVVRHGSISCSGEDAKVFEFAINADLCSELLVCLAHSIETCRVGARHKFSFLNSWNFFFDVDHVRKIQIRLWTFCLDGSEIVCNGSLLCRAKETKVVPSVTNSDPCLEPVPYLAHTSVPNRVVGSQFFLCLDSSVWLVDVLLAWQHDRTLWQPF
jgi:hypothetical protein